MPTQLDPRFSTDANSSRVGSLVFAALLRPGNDGGYEPYLASAWSQPDPLTYRFSLRRDFRFEDGSALTTRDVVATYRALAAPGLGSPRGALLSRLARIDSEGDEIVFTLREPDAAFMEAATFAILKAEAADSPPGSAQALAATGPYRVESMAADKHITLVVNDAYPDKRPGIDRLVFRIVPEATMRALELEKGSISFVQNGIDPDTLAWMKHERIPHNLNRGPSNTSQYLGINHRYPPLADVRVRRAIAHAIDVDAIVEHVLKGTATVATGLLPPHHWAYTSRVRRYAFDPDEARRLLRRAGYRRLQLSYKTTTQELSRRVAEVLAYQLSQVGVDLEVSSFEWGTFYGDIKRGNFHLYSLAWVGIADPDILRLVFHTAMTPPDGNNRGKFSHPRMDRITDAARTETDRQARTRLYRRAQRIAARRLPYVPLWWPDNMVVSTTRLQGFTPDPSGDLLPLASASMADDNVR